MRHALHLLALCFVACAAPRRAYDYDVLIRGGSVYDGSGAAPFTADVALSGDRIARIGDLTGATAATVIDARGQAVAPGFVNVLSWATESLLVDGRGLGDLVQGVTLEVFGEGWSMGPWNEAMRVEVLEGQADLSYDVPWHTLGEYLAHLEARGVACNVASFVGATTVRIHELGYVDRLPTDEELARMCALVRDAMEEGALGVGSSLIYAPAYYASTEELIALCEVAAEYGGRYITHMRSESTGLLEALDEVVRIVRATGIGAEVYHLKAAGRENWPKLDVLIARVEALRAEGLDLTADMYTYTAGATGLDAMMPPWVQEGGYDAWAARLADPAVRARVLVEIRTPSDAWENLYLAAGDPERVLLVGFQNPALKPLTGKSLGAVARERGVSPEEVAMDLVIEDGSRVDTVYFVMSEENVQKKLALPWVAFGSDAGSFAPVAPFLATNPHPRAYGNFARLLGRYVRDEQVLSLAEAIRRLTSFPADNFRLEGRGRLVPGAFADVVVFDPRTIADHATYDRPHQLATGVSHVLVNGVPTLANGAPTGRLAGRFVRGPGHRPE